MPRRSLFLLVVTFFLSVALLPGIRGSVSKSGTTYKVNVILEYNGSGDWAFIADTITLSAFWKTHLESAFSTMSDWLLDINLEFIDGQSNCTLTESLLEARVQNVSAGPVAVIVSEGDDCVTVGKFGAKYNIPVVYGVLQPDLSVYYNTDTSLNYKLPAEFNTTFLIAGATMRTFEQLVQAYVGAGVKTVVAVANERYDFYNRKSCFGAVDTLSSRGVDVQRITITLNDSTPRVVEIIEQLRDDIKPDAVIWCDWTACAFDENIAEFNPMSHFRDADYLPKALSMLDCVDLQYIQHLYEEGLMEFVTGPSFASDKIRGLQYTEDATPYSSVFRSPNIPTGTNYTSVSQENVGNIDSMPSSTKLFYEWYRSETNQTANYWDAGMWAAFDVVEKVLYLATQNSAITADGVISASEVIYLLSQANVRTPFGPVAFDVNKINTLTSPIFLQALPTSVTAEIVSPSTMQTSNFVYPMPTWKERFYKWSLTGSQQARISIGIAAGCSFVMLLLLITVIRFHKQQDVKMLHYLHMVAMLVSGSAYCWVLSLMWQDDMNQTQCSGYLWGVYVPASFFIHLVNMKAYRLSSFLRAALQEKRRKPFTHMMVLRNTFALLLVTLFLLAIAHGVDPPTSTLVVPDPYRPLLNYHVCSTGSVTPALLYLIVCFHVIVSLDCVAAVRNGMEAFRDGMLIKEAMLLFYGSIIIVLVLESLGLSHSMMYVLRSAFLEFGCLTFCLRLLLSRCHHWLPQSVLDVIKIVGMSVKRAVAVFVPDNSLMMNNASSAHIYLSAEHILSEDSGEFNVMGGLEKPSDDSLADLMRVFSDPARLELLRSVGKEAHVTENVEFIATVLDYQNNAAAQLVSSSTQVSIGLKAQAKQIFDEYLMAHSINEVNVSASTRTYVGNLLKGWQTHTPLLTQALAQSALQEDAFKRYGLFEKPLKEISTVLYHNIWTKFRTKEATNAAAEEEYGPTGSPSGKFLV